MTAIQLTGGAYQTRSILASAQRMVNLYSEATPQAQGEPFSTIEYPVPGKSLLGTAPQPICRCLYKATTGNLYACFGQAVYYIDPNWRFNKLGDIVGSSLADAVPRTTNVSMSDNGLVLLMVDGSADGWYVDITLPLASQVLHRIDPNVNSGWLGGDRVDYLSTYFVLNSPGTNIFYCSVAEANAQSFQSEFTVIASTVVAGGSGYSVDDLITFTGTGNAQATVLTTDPSTGAILTANVVQNGGLVTQPATPVPVTGGTGTGATFTLIYTQGTGAFSPLDFAAKSEIADNIVSVVAVHGVLWLIGRYSYEIWYVSGGGGSGALTNNTFPFDLSPGLVGNIGCAAVHSVATATVNDIFWLAQDASGKCIVLRGAGEAPNRVSTHAIETQISRYPRVDDAIGYAYQQDGHTFYVLTFPSAPNMQGRADAGATWVFDASQELWHERVSTDANGIEFRDRANATAEAYGKNVCGDWENELLYFFDLDNYTENNQPVVRWRDFPHQIDTDGNRRIIYHQIIANMQVGAQIPFLPQPDLVDATFVAADGTLLQNYDNPTDINPEFTLITGNSLQIFNDQVWPSSYYGFSEYASVAIPSGPDYQIEFKMGLTDYTIIPSNGSILFSIGHAVGPGTGYQAFVYSDGTNLSTGVKSLPNGFNMSTLMAGPGVITAPVIITMRLRTYPADMANDLPPEVLINFKVQRTQDNLYLIGNGQWSPIAGGWMWARTDSTWLNAGSIAIGGDWLV